MKLKAKYLYAQRWRLSSQLTRPLSSITNNIYLGYEDRESKDFVLNDRLAIIKTIKYQPGARPDDVRRQREIFRCQLDVLALNHFMLPEPYDYCTITNMSTAGVTGTDLAEDEPLLVYAYNPGQIIADEIDNAGTFSTERALRITQQIISFIDFLHLNGYGHLAVNPYHFLVHRDSVRVLGLSKIVPLNQNGLLQPHGSLFLPPEERVFCPLEALLSKQFYPGLAFYGLGMLLFYMISGRKLPELTDQGKKPLPDAAIDQLPIAPPVKLLIKSMLNNFARSDIPHLSQEYLQRVEEAIRAQQIYEDLQSTRTKRFGIFVDFENFIAAFNPKGTNSRALMVLDLDAIASAYARLGSVYKFVVIPQYRTRGFTQRAIANLIRAGWEVQVVAANNDDGKLRMGEIDDSHLISEGVRFLELAKPERIVIVSNDSDYLSLVQKARFMQSNVTVIYGSLRYQGRSLSNISNLYLQELRKCGANIHLIHTYPFVFQEETFDLNRALGLKKIPASRSQQYRILLWEFVHQLGYEVAISRLRQADAYQVLRQLYGFPADYYPAFVSFLKNTQNLDREVERIRSRRSILIAFQPTNHDILQFLLQFPDNRRSLLKALAKAAPLVESEWGFIKNHQQNTSLLELFLEFTNPQLREQVKNNAGEVLTLRNRLKEQWLTLLPMLNKYGGDLIHPLKKYGASVLYPLRKYEASGFAMLCGPQCDVLMHYEHNPQMREWVEAWYEEHGNLDVITILNTKPQLADLTMKAGFHVLTMYRNQETLETIHHTYRLAILMFQDLEVADQARRHLAINGIQIEKALQRLEELQEGKTQLLQLFEQKTDTETLLLSLEVCMVVKNTELDALVPLYQALGKPVLRAYKRFGAELLSLVKIIGPNVINVLEFFPDAYSALQQYKTAAFHLIRRYRQAAIQMFNRLNHVDLSPILATPSITDVIQAWYAKHQDLRVFDSLIGDTALEQLRRVSDPKDAVYLLEVYLRDRDDGLMSAVLSLYEQKIFSLQDSYELVAEGHRTRMIAIEHLVGIITTHSGMFNSLPDPRSRVELVQVLVTLQTSKHFDFFVELYTLYGAKILKLYAQFGDDVLALAKQLSDDIVPFIEQHPKSYKLIQKYKHPAYRFIQRYREGEDVMLDLLHRGHELDLLFTAPVTQLLDLWYKQSRNLHLVHVIVTDREIVGLCQKYNFSLLPIFMWAELRKKDPGLRSPTRVLQEYEQILFNQNYDYKKLIPLIPTIGASVLMDVVGNYYEQLITLPTVGEQIKFCQVIAVLTPEFIPEFISHCQQFTIPLILTLIDKGEIVILDLLNAMKHKARSFTVKHAQSTTGLANYVRDLWQHRQHWIDLPEDNQLKFVQATTRSQSVAEVIEALDNYGISALDELIRNGKLGVWFNVRNLFSKRGDS